MSIALAVRVPLVTRSTECFAPRLTADARPSAFVRTTTALCQTQPPASAVHLPLVQPRMVSTAFLQPTFVAKHALSASTEAQAPMACVRENISSVFVWEFKIFYFYFFLFLFKLTIIFCTFLCF